jgi:hypothetical protein
MMRAQFGLPSVKNSTSSLPSVYALPSHTAFYCSLLLPSAAEDLEKRAPISVKFEIPYFTVSGIQVRYLKIVEKSGYQALPWVRYITQHGDDYRYAFFYEGEQRLIGMQFEDGTGEGQCAYCQYGMRCRLDGREVVVG